MITNLRIQNVALIHEVEVNFAPGFNVLTGETGAGKSILVDSINFLLGERPMRDFIRAGAEFATVEGVLKLDESLMDSRGGEPSVREGLSQLGIDTSDGQLVLFRQIQAASGKSTCRINGHTASVSLLKDAAALLVDLHGQHEHQSLLDPGRQLKLLDQLCGGVLAECKTELERLLSEYRKTDKALKALAQAAGKEQVEIWRFQLDEIEQANLNSSPEQAEKDEDALVARKARLSGLEKLSKNALAAMSYLDESDTAGQLSARDQLARALAHMGDMAKLDPGQEKLYMSMHDTLAQLTDISRELRNYMDELDADPKELEQIESRLDIIYRLKKKYGPGLSQVLEKREELTRSLENLENSDSEIKALHAARKGITQEITALCDKMSALRTATAEAIERDVSGILNDLGMQNARFAVEITRKTTFGSDGNDMVEFMICPNPGEPMKPLRRIASGGEMSRVMLAIKTVTAEADRVSTVIFDEVDTGVSGRTAQQVAEKLMRVSRRRQILCITHLPQIAAMADTHFLIAKAESEGRTITSVQALDMEKIINELARLTGGAEITTATLEAAKEMKVQADGLKQRKQRWVRTSDGENPGENADGWIEEWSWMKCPITSSNPDEAEQ